MSDPGPLSAAVLPAGVRSRIVRGVNGLDVHVLEAGFEPGGRPCVLLLHGFPEIAYSWRKIMLPIAQAGFRVVAPDLRGYGRTTGWSAEFDAPLEPFRGLAYVRDALALVAALGFRSVQMVGHDMGSFVAASCALVRPDVFRSAVLMSAPFAGVPELPFGTADAAPRPSSPRPSILDELAVLPRPRKHYQWYYSTREANGNMRFCPQGVHAFLRAYFHHKSADWKQNRPFRLAAWSAAELAKMPTYYIMDLDQGMAETVAPEMPGREAIAACKWLPDAELAVYAAEYERTGFQGGLQWYRCKTSGRFEEDLSTFAGRAIDVPSMFISGASDWGPYQVPGALERMQEKACTRMTGCHLLEGAGHWVQQEQPEAVGRLLIDFLKRHA